MIFAKLPGSRVWHVERYDVHTVCGVTLIGVVRECHVGKRAPTGERLCRSCDRMKDAASMRLR